MCECELCARNRSFTAILESMTEEQKEYFEALYEHLNNVEFDSNVNEIYMSNLREKYPEIYNEVRTLRNINEKEQNV